MEVSFPAIEVWDGNREVVSFPALVDGEQIQCSISLEALQDDFSARINQPLDAFQENRALIEEIAERLLNQRRFEPNGSIFIRSGDRS